MRTALRFGITLFASVIAALAASSCLTPESLFEIRGISDPQIRPTDGAAVFVESWVDKKTDSTYSHIRIGRGESFESLHSGNIHEHTPRFSPDGQWLIYFSDHDGKSRLWLRSPADGKERPLDLKGHAPGSIRWSPDSQWLGFTSFVETEPEWNPKIPAPPADAKWADPPHVITTMRYAMDGAGLMKPGSVRLFALSIKTGKILQVSHHPYWHTSYLSAPELTWRADSKALISPAVKANDGWRVFDESILFSFPLDGGEPQKLGPAKWHQSQAEVSPDDAKIAFSGYAWKGQSYHVSQLWVQERSLTPKLDRDVTTIKWSPDGSGIYFLSDNQGDINLYFAPLKGEVRQITKGRQRIASYSLTKNGKALAIVSTPTQPGMLIEISLKEGSQRNLFAPNPNFCQLVAPEEIWYTVADGLRIQGWLLKPPGFDRTKKYPMVVSIHGGPHASYGNSFQPDLQIYAQHGYVVLYTNPRGSTGYGEEFGRVIQHRWPGEDINDILNGVDEVVKKGFVDSERLGVIGGSGGGLMTSWMVTQTNRFKAAVAWWPVTNWITHVGVGDNGFYISSVYRKAMPWEDPDDYIRHSPLFQISKVKTPTMVMCGEEDWRVPIAQSEEFYRALKVRGVPTVLIRYPGESHGVLKRTSHRMNVLAHSLAWLDRYTGLAQ